MNLSINLFADFAGDFPSQTAAHRKEQSGLGWQPTAPFAMLAALPSLAVLFRRLLRLQPPINPTAAPRPQTSRRLTAAAWGALLLASTLPDILWVELTGGPTNWLPWIKAALFAILAIAALIWNPLRPLRNYFIALVLFFVLSQARVLWHFNLPFVQRLFGTFPFVQQMQPEQFGKLAVSMAMLAALFALGYRRDSLFLISGNLRAPITPVPLLGFPKADPWTRFGGQWGVYIALALAVFMYLGVRPSNADLLRAAGYLPAVLFFAALNAFNEEVTYRVSLLSTLEPVTGSRHALWMAAVFFGIAHYFGAPGGIPGALLSVFMGWILSKAMLETRGFFWAWWIHFLSDISIFFFFVAAG